MASLRVLTYNISGLNVSALAPPGFAAEKYAAVAAEVLHHEPHLISLQEVFAQPGNALDRALRAAGYELHGETESHCGMVQVWAHASLRAEELRSVGPVAIARVPLPLPGGADGADGGQAGQGGFLYFAGAHLEPFAQGAQMRLKQITAALRSLPPRGRVLLAGDFNMRNAENSSVAELGLTDAFLQLRSPRDANFTWDTRTNLYYGDDTQQYTARYDRVLLRGLDATALRIVANRPHTPGRGDYLSDHFGLLATLRISPQPPGSPPPALRASGAPEEEGSSDGDSENRGLYGRGLFG